MRVLGLDPGTATTGYGVVEGRGTRLAHVAHGTVRTSSDQAFADRLVAIHSACCELIEQHRPDAVALEKIFFSRHVTTGIAGAQARGVIALAAALASIPISEFSPLEVKSAVVGYGRATKAQVQEMTRILLGLPERPRPDDAADALALAVCRIHAGGLERRTPRR